MPAAAVVADVLAKTGEAAKSGPLWAAVVLVLCVACYFLFKSMSRHLKNVRQNFPAESAEPAEPATSAPEREPDRTDQA